MFPLIFGVFIERWKIDKIYVYSTHVRICNYRVCFSIFPKFDLSQPFFDEWTTLIDWIVFFFQSTHRIIHGKNFRLEKMLIVAVHHVISLILSTFYMNALVCEMSYFHLSTEFSPKSPNYRNIRLEINFVTNKMSHTPWFHRKFHTKISCIPYFQAKFNGTQGNLNKTHTSLSSAPNIQVLKCVCDRKCARSSLAWAVWRCFFFSHT